MLKYVLFFQFFRVFPPVFLQLWMKIDRFRAFPPHLLVFQLSKETFFPRTLKKVQRRAKQKKMTISYSDFSKVDMRVGKILDAADFPEAKKPAFRLKIDFGPEIGTKNSSAQLTKRYRKEDLLGRKIIAVVNFPPKQVANFLSEVLVLGVEDETGGIVLLSVENFDDAPPGSRVY